MHEHLGAGAMAAAIDVLMDIRAAGRCCHYRFEPSATPSLSLPVTSVLVRADFQHLPAACRIEPSQMLLIIQHVLLAEGIPT